MSAAWRVEFGDCVERMAATPDASIDAIVTDPPYHLAFMGKAWDTVTPGESQREHERWAREALRVLKPGGHLLAFGGTRTYHRLAVGIEDAGFQIRDTIAWIYGSGFPKSLDVSKAIDRAAGAEREVIGEQPDRWTGAGGVLNFATDRPQDTVPITAGPATPEGERWDGWGTALKPAFEPIVVARKPLIGTVAANVLEHGTGALNIDGCRVGVSAEDAKAMERCNTPGSGRFKASEGTSYGRPTPSEPLDTAQGRWPANVVMDSEAGTVLDEQAPETGAQRPVMGNEPSPPFRSDGVYGENTTRKHGPFHGDRGGASRFFYCPKASRAERNAGLDGFAPKPILWSNGEENPGSFQADGTEREARNPHPTVKPIDLMRWLVRLVTPPGGRVLDPFVGSGTTGCAAVLEGFDFVGIERDADYAKIAEARIAWWAEHPEGIDTDDALEGNARRRRVAETGQTSLL